VQMGQTVQGRRGEKWTGYIQQRSTVPSHEARCPHTRIFYLPTNKKYKYLKIKRQKRTCVRKTPSANVIPLSVLMM
jgi:hypothetical protein